LQFAELDREQRGEDQDLRTGQAIGFWRHAQRGTDTIRLSGTEGETPVWLAGIETEPFRHTSDTRHRSAELSR
jgi:hypothetical protein